tara:strand:- start:324 stop:530 length:207 start_codon:yes stop_codon:yes gene_type:complete
MKSILVFTVSLIFLFPSKTFAKKSNEAILACKSFAAGEIDAHQTLKVLKLNVNNYSIGVRNTAKILCS